MALFRSEPFDTGNCVPVAAMSPWNHAYEGFHRSHRPCRPPFGDVGVRRFVRFILGMERRGKRGFLLHSRWRNAPRSTG